LTALPERLAERICWIAENGRLGLQLSDGSLIDPMIGEPYASRVRQTVAAAIRAALDEAAATVEGCDREAKRWQIADAIRALKA
jgi:hypothetical protein